MSVDGSKPSKSGLLGALDVLAMAKTFCDKAFTREWNKLFDGRDKGQGNWEETP